MYIKGSVGVTEQKEQNIIFTQIDKDYKQVGSKKL